MSLYDCYTDFKAKPRAFEQRFNIEGKGAGTEDWEDGTGGGWWGWVDVNSETMIKQSFVSVPRNQRYAENSTCTRFVSR